MSTTILNLTTLNDTIDTKNNSKQYTNKTEHIKLLTDFEIHVSEASTLTNKILELAGVKLKQGDISQVGRVKSNEKSQIRNK